MTATDPRADLGTSDTNTVTCPKCGHDTWVAIYPVDCFRFGTTITRDEHGNVDIYYGDVVYYGDGDSDSAYRCAHCSMLYDPADLLAPSTRTARKDQP